MLPQALFLRHQEVVLYLQRARRPVPFAELQRYILEDSPAGDYDKGYSERTFQRDLPLIAQNFGVTIKARRNAGYYIAETDPLPANQQRVAEAFQLHGFFRLPDALTPFVQVEQRRPLGLEHLRPLLRAARARLEVEFRYAKHWEATPTSRRVGPLLLKEFRGRWYVLAVVPATGKLRCFGLDRIAELTVSRRSFTVPEGFDAATYYEHAFGITRPDEPETMPVEVILAFEATQGRYALSYPLHPSQRVLEQSADAIQLSLTVFDTHELRMELLSYGEHVRVLAPAALRGWLQQQHAAAGHMY